MTAKIFQYRRKILRQLYFENILSCSDISERIEKSIPLTTKVLSELVSEGAVLETGHAPSTGGRRPLMYSIKPDIIYIVSVAMDQFVSRIAILDMHNNFVTPEVKFELPLANTHNALEQLAHRINMLVAESGIDKKSIIGVGIGMPGLIDIERDINYSFFETKQKGVTEFLGEIVGMPVFIDNDSSLIALAELRFGIARNKKNAMVINIGWGIGLGLILNGRLFRGNNGFAGEFSHIPLFSNGKICSCGKMGCLETEASLAMVAEKAQTGLNKGKVSILKSIPEDYEQATETIINAATRGDQFSIELLSESGYSIGRAAAILIHVLNPEVIILSGRGASAGRVWQAPIQQAINEHCIPRLAEKTSIEISSLSHHAELIGAAALVMEHFEKVPF
ncbi:ROK family protein [Pinibacter aurantiacus]|uniref:ROK family protein n=1 Tax=Pinibacter aurantiacus TaxID=2851599 RepID=A0A9E2SC89_9BACT|nr:ROK family protein [Pinibacter aurantiacus]MBV4360428.1 ROK family protein [Pinibacter aurantiacus]